MPFGTTLKKASKNEVEAVNCSTHGYGLTVDLVARPFGTILRKASTN